MRVCSATNATTSRQATNYYEEEDGDTSPNYDTLCPACQLEADKYWADMWDMYYNSQGI